MPNHPRSDVEDEAMTRYPEPESRGPLDTPLYPEDVAEREREAFEAGAAWGCARQEERISRLIAQIAQLQRDYDECARDLQNREMNPDYYY